MARENDVCCSGGKMGIEKKHVFDGLDEKTRKGCKPNLFERVKLFCTVEANRCSVHQGRSILCLTLFLNTWFTIY